MYFNRECWLTAGIITMKMVGEDKDDWMDWFGDI